MKTLTVRLKEAENRAENAEKSVKRLQKEVDRLEGNVFSFNSHFPIEWKNRIGQNWGLSVDIWIGVQVGWV